VIAKSAIPHYNSVLGYWAGRSDMHVQIEFFGLSRLVTGVKEIALDLEDGATFRDVARRLGETYPALIGDVIRSDDGSLQHPNVLNVNARRMIRADKMDESPRDGDRIILMSMSAGG
jgi:molybdopterin converting factor small subunit